MSICWSVLRHGLTIGLVALLVPSTPASAGKGDPWLVDGDYVNLRRAPTTSAEIKRQLSKGVEVIERARQGDWHQVEVESQGGVIGWVHNSLLRREVAVRPASLPTPKAPAALALRDAVVDKGASPDKASNPIIPADDDIIIKEMLNHVKRRQALPSEPKVKPRIGQSGREIIGPVPIRKPGDQSRVPTELVLASSDVKGLVDIEAMEIFRESVTYLNNRAWSVAGIKLFSEIEPIGGGVVQVKATEDWFEVPAIGQQSYLKTLLDRWSSAKDDGGPAGIMLVDADGDLLMHQTKP